MDWILFTFVLIGQKQATSLTEDRVEIFIVIGRTADDRLSGTKMEVSYPNTVAKLQFTPSSSSSSSSSSVTYIRIG